MHENDAEPSRAPLADLLVVQPDASEAGVVDVRLRGPAREDPLFDGFDEKIPMAAMHGDTIAALPSHAVWLADSEAYPHQAYRVGSCAWGVQFHPEISPLTFQSSATEFRSPDAEDVRRVELGLIELPAQDVLVIAAARSLAARFADLVGARAAHVDRR